MKLAVTLAFVGVLLSAASAAAKVSASPNVAALVAARGDVPKQWFVWTRPDPVSECIAASGARAWSGEAHSRIGTPNSDVSSLALLFPDRSSADRYYGRALAAAPGCVHGRLAAMGPAVQVVAVQKLRMQRYGVGSSASRLRFTNGSFRHGVDWVIVDTGKAVLVDVFTMGIYDERWRDISAARGLGGTVSVIERRVLSSALVRAAHAGLTH